VAEIFSGAAEKSVWNWQAEDRQGARVIQLTQPPWVSGRLSQCVAGQWESSRLHFSAGSLSHPPGCYTSWLVTRLERNPPVENVKH